jgi:hypothetical protein
MTEVGLCPPEIVPWSHVQILHIRSLISHLHVLALQGVDCSQQLILALNYAQPYLLKFLSVRELSLVESRLMLLLQVIKVLLEQDDLLS